MAKRPRDPNQLAKFVVEMATGNVREAVPKSSPASEFARLGGLKGGKARALALKSSERSAIAKKAAQARWRQRKDGGD